MAETIDLPKGKTKRSKLDEFLQLIINIDKQVGMPMSARGWGYTLEGEGLITKAEIDRVENLINDARKTGLLPIDFTAQEEARQFSGIEKPEELSPIQFMTAYVKAVLECEQWYIPNWWDGEDYYIQMVVEKIDLKNLFSPICQEYHIPIATCFDSETEILSRSGWKRFTDLSFDDEVATMSEEGRLVYAKPSRIINEPYKGKMYAIKNKGTDQKLTPNHRVYVKRQRNRKDAEHFELTAIEEVAHLQNLRFKKNIEWIGIEKKTFSLPLVKHNGAYNELKEELDMDCWLEFLGYYISEGSTSAKPNHIYHIQLAQKNPAIKTKMVACINRLGYRYYEDLQSIQLSNKQLYQYLHPLGKAWEKFIPREFMELSQRQLRILLNALIDGDGHRRNGRKSERAVYITSSKRLADDVQEIALKAGYNASVSLRPEIKGKIKGRDIKQQHQIYAVNICCGLKSFRINHDKSKNKKDVSIVEYSGSIHCVEVPSGIIYVRRNGKPVWSGNSKGWSSIIQRAEYAKRFNEAEDMGLECVLLYCGDHDPDGLRISSFLHDNLAELKDIIWKDGTDGYDPENLIIDRFGLNYDFIAKNNLVWIENLITGSGKNLASKSHKNYGLEYVQTYLRQFGARKVEANAILKNRESAMALCREAIEKYLGADALHRFQIKKDEIHKTMEDFRINSGLRNAVEHTLEIIENLDEEDQSGG